MTINDLQQRLTAFDNRVLRRDFNDLRVVRLSLKYKAALVNNLKTTVNEIEVYRKKDIDLKARVVIAFYWTCIAAVAFIAAAVIARYI